MILDYRRDDAAHLTQITLSGDVTRAEVRKLLDRQAEEGTWNYRVLYDERAANVTLSAADMQLLAVHAATLAKTHGPRGPIAIVTASDVDYGVNRMVSAYAEMAGYEIQVFRHLEEAREWLRGRA